METTGHMPYSKSNCLYLQTIEDLLGEYSWLHINFCYKVGCHLVRRSNHHWTGLFANLVIEPVLCELLKIEAISQMER